VSKSDYTIGLISKKEAASILLEYHYLKDISRGFKSGINYGLFLGKELVGVCIYTGFPVPELVKGMFGLDRTDQNGFYELSRLCLLPDVQRSEHNLASWFVSRTIRDMKKNHAPRCILSYADSSFHEGIVYKACNFKYYGLSDLKKDFWIKQEDGSYIKHTRGKVKVLEGEWRPRTQKHRYVMCFDKSLNMKWKEK